MGRKLEEIGLAAKPFRQLACCCWVGWGKQAFGWNGWRGSCAGVLLVKIQIREWASSLSIGKPHAHGLPAAGLLHSSQAWLEAPQWPFVAPVREAGCGELAWTNCGPGPCHQRSEG